MRLRNIPRADSVLENSSIVIKNEEGKHLDLSFIFSNENPVWIEIGMGKGRFIIEMAKSHPEVNFIGIERYSSVLLRAIEKLEEEGDQPANLRLMRFDAAEIETIFGEKEISRIFLNFSDPWPKDRHAKRRLTSRQFLNRYDTILKEEGTVEFKTDNRELFDFSLEEIKESKWKLEACTFDLHHEETMVIGNIMTEYEEKFSSMGNPICKLIISR